MPQIPVEIEVGCDILAIYYNAGGRDTCTDFIHGKVVQVDNSNVPDPRIHFDMVDPNGNNVIGAIKRFDIFGFTFGGIWQQNPTFKKPRNFYFQNINAVIEYFKQITRGRP